MNYCFSSENTVHGWKHCSFGQFVTEHCSCSIFFEGKFLAKEDHVLVEVEHIIRNIDRKFMGGFSSVAKLLDL